MQDGDTYVNEHGGRQSYVSARMDLIPPENLILLAQCLGFGAVKYGENNWHQIPQNENLNHAMVHILKWLSGDRTEPHLVNVLARVNFALWHAIQDGEQGKTYVHPDMKSKEVEKQDAKSPDKEKQQHKTESLQFFIFNRLRAEGFYKNLTDNELKNQISNFMCENHSS